MINYNQNFFSSSIPEAFTEDQIQLKNKFESTYHDLEALVQLGSLNKHNLLSIYIKGINHTGSASCAGTELGTQHIFEGLVNKPNDKSLVTYDDYVVSELMHAIARAISTGCMSPDELIKEKSIVTSRAL